MVGERSQHVREGVEGRGVAWHVGNRERVRETRGTPVKQTGRVSTALFKGLTASDLKTPCLRSNRSLYTQPTTHHSRKVKKARVSISR